MSVGTIIEAMFNGETVTVPDTTEAAFDSFWHDQAHGTLSPVEAAVAGGLAAQGLSQVFMAGYQAALRQVFPWLPTEGWAAFVAAEDRADPENHPGTVLTDSNDGPRISGFKSWVGQSRHVRHLLVTAKQGEAVRVALVDRDTPGLTLSHRDSPKFLADLSQGFAAFDAVAPDRLLEGFDPRTFGRAEPQFIMLAGAAFLAARLSGTARDSALALTMALSAYCAANQFRPKTFAALDRELTALADKVAPDAVPGWESDRQLLSMYSPRIQKRA